MFTLDHLVVIRFALEGRVVFTLDHLVVIRFALEGRVVLSHDLFAVVLGCFGTLEGGVVFALEQSLIF